MEKTIKCPVCKADIYFSVEELLNGKYFKCRCGAVIKLASESKDIATDTFKKLKSIKIEKKEN